eukprot:TRINITY_DN20982_c0_g1_i1.p1 TRINITY_DN20982_c0_g1~~TRINITY_DN20982_c0_g1_i1.p1  ORF type:complete len:224 (+),score=40.00 TRINITY_DN20982_c0_g1_i1:213-884(+)
MQHYGKKFLQNSLRVYAITDDAFLSGIEDKVKGLISGGIRSIQVRIKKGDDSELAELTKDIIKIARPAGMLVLVNDKAEVCWKTGADGVHIGGEDGCLKEARSLIGQDKILGTTVYGNPSLLSCAISSGVEYVGSGSIFPTSTKSATCIGLDSIPPLRQLIDSSSHQPLLISIGGITVDNCSSCIANGADGVAISSGLLNVDAPFAINCERLARIALNNVTIA